ncbi:calpain 2, (m II) large subunit [Cichlidogyrus casuarinus]|uniref:Calpain 2, (M II) large subunit n=1 Tax=Cichlidogyrus casuarinus TaxID=1844966 RepID=A0ABD2QJY4_9PLAT
MYRALGRLEDPRWLKKCQDETGLILSYSIGDVVADPVPAGRNGKLPLSRSTFHKICRQHIFDGKIWEDEDFPANDSSLGEVSNVTIEWKRPKDLVSNPQFFSGGSMKFDINEMTLPEDYWFISSIFAVAFRSDLMANIIPRNQKFEQDYCGAFRFKFYLQGKWREVIVDDRLPSCNNRCKYVAFGNPSEFCCPLIHKAYAKQVTLH